MKKIPSLEEFLSEGVAAGVAASFFAASTEPRISKKAQVEVGHLVQTAEALIRDPKSTTLAGNLRRKVTEMIGTWPPDDDLRNYFDSGARAFTDPQVEVITRAVGLAVPLFK